MSRLTRRGRAVLVGGLVLVAAGIALGVADLTRVGVLLLALPLVAAVLTGRRGSLTARRSITPARVLPGSPARVVLEVGNPGRTPTPALLADERVTYALGDRPRILVARLAPGESREIVYQVRSHVRGRHVVGPLGVRISDAFGLASRDEVVPGSASVVVLPRVVPLGEPPSGSAGAGGSEVQLHRLSLHGESEIGVRDYREGDDLRRIHWPSTARTGEMMVRQDEQPARRRALVLLDTRAAAHSGIGAAGSFEWAVSAAASIAVHLIGSSFETTLATAEPHLDPVPLASVDEALDALALVETTEQTDHAPLVEAVADAHARGSATTIAVVGPLDAESCERLTRLGPGMALVIDPSVFGSGGAQRSSTAAHLAAGGWRAVDVTPGARVADLWAQVARPTAALR